MTDSIHFHHSISRFECVEQAFDSYSRVVHRLVLMSFLILCPLAVALLTAVTVYSESNIVHEQPLFAVDRHLRQMLYVLIYLVIRSVMTVMSYVLCKVIAASGGIIVDGILHIHVLYVIHKYVQRSVTAAQDNLVILCKRSHELRI